MLFDIKTEIILTYLDESLSISNIMAGLQEWLNIAQTQIGQIPLLKKSTVVCQIFWAQKIERNLKTLR